MEVGRHIFVTPPAAPFIISHGILDRITFGKYIKIAGKMYVASDGVDHNRRCQSTSAIAQEIAVPRSTGTAIRGSWQNTERVGHTASAGAAKWQQIVCQRFGTANRMENGIFGRICWPVGRLPVDLSAAMDFLRRFGGAHWNDSTVSNFPIFILLCKNTTFHEQAFAQN